MTRKLLMISTAIVALSIAPAAFAQTNMAPAGTKPAPAAAQHPVPSGVQQYLTGQSAQAPAATPSTSSQPKQAMSSEMPKSKSKAMKTSGKASSKMIHKASANHKGHAYRDMNGREIQQTRDLNRNGFNGQQSAMAPSDKSPIPPTAGAAPGTKNPAGQAGAGGSPADSTNR